MKLMKDLSKEEQTALRTEVCPDATDGQIDYFLRVCHAKNIDPFSGLLYLQIRTANNKKKAIVAATIDGARLAASRSGEYAGSDEPEYDKDDGTEPSWCRVTVYRMIDEVRCAFTAKIRMKEWKPTGAAGYMWNQKPYHMLGKATEAQALRKAFPDYVAAAGEDEQEEISESSIQTETAETVQNPQVLIDWAKAVGALSAFGIDENRMLQHVGLATKQDATEEHIEQLRLWYDELKLDAQEAAAARKKESK